MMKKFLLFSIAVCTLLVVGSSSCTKKDNTIAVTGKVMNSQNIPVTNAQVSLGNQSTVTDALGVFNFSGILQGEYPLTIKATGYNDYIQNINTFSSTKNVLTLDNIILSSDVVYAVGANVNGQYIAVATLWKNGIPKDLSDATTDEYANSVYVKDNDVYIVGYMVKNNKKVAILWKNEIKTELPYIDANQGVVANSIFVSNSGDVFIVGTAITDSYSYTAICWKNGVLTPSLVPNGATANSLYILGNDVYIAGSGSNARAAYWKNGTITQLNTNISTANSIFVVGNDVYVAGTVGGNFGQSGTPMLWKNSISQNISLPTEAIFGGFATGVFVADDGNVYVSGYYFDPSNRVPSGILWKNGAAPTLIERYASISSIYVLGKDVYLAGNDGGTAHSIWKNGIKQKLNGSFDNGSLNGIFVKKLQ